MGVQFMKPPQGLGLRCHAIAQESSLYLYNFCNQGRGNNYFGVFYGYTF